LVGGVKIAARDEHVGAKGIVDARAREVTVGREDVILVAPVDIDVCVGDDSDVGHACRSRDGHAKGKARSGSVHREVADGAGWGEIQEILRREAGERRPMTAGSAKIEVESFLKSLKLG
jgi:hypothetical protein